MLLMSQIAVTRINLMLNNYSIYHSCQYVQSAHSLSPGHFWHKFLFSFQIGSMIIVLVKQTEILHKFLMKLSYWLRLDFTMSSNVSFDFACFLQLISFFTIFTLKFIKIIAFLDILKLPNSDLISLQSVLGAW